MVIMSSDAYKVYQQDKYKSDYYLLGKKICRHFLPPGFLYFNATGRPETSRFISRVYAPDPEIAAIRTEQHA